jgi:formylglycine-generating enzyme required for sulfatase activity
METKKCPFCGKTVLAVSKNCKHCGKSFESQPTENVTIKNTQSQKPIIPTLEMVFVKGGKFSMGNDDGKNFPNEYPAHIVTLNDFYIGKYPVTQAQWKAVMGDNPSRFKGDNLPVETVSWDDIQAFIGLLNMQTDNEYRLPTEAEWEYAAHGGDRTEGYKYSGSDNLDMVAWFFENTKGFGTCSVGTKQANELNIYDMSGNVWEWCNDRYGKYGNNSQINPEGPATGSYRVNRGGSWGNFADYCRVVSRIYNLSSDRDSSLGFRLACSSKQATNGL